MIVHELIKQLQELAEMGHSTDEVRVVSHYGQPTYEEADTVRALTVPLPPGEFGKKHVVIIE